MKWFNKEKTLDEFEQETIKNRTSLVKDYDLTRYAFEYVRTKDDDEKSFIYMKGFEKISMLPVSQEEKEKWQDDFTAMIELIENKFG